MRLENRHRTVNTHETTNWCYQILQFNLLSTRNVSFDGFWYYGRIHVYKVKLINKFTNFTYLLIVFIIVKYSFISQEASQAIDEMGLILRVFI